MQFLFWDWLIANLLVGQAAAFVLVLKTRIIKKKLTQTVAALLLFFGFSVIFYGSFIEPRMLVVRHEKIDLTAASMVAPSSTIKIALISDFHLGPYQGAGLIKKVIKKLASEKPDIAVLLGDFVYDSDTEARALNLFKDLNIPKLAVLGNHDYRIEIKDQVPQLDLKRAEAVKKALAQGQVNTLINQSGKFENKVWLIGLDEFWTGRSDLKKALAEVTDNKPRIVLVHNPTAITLFEDEVDLVLAGHTHGGQIRLPLIGPVGQIPTGLGQHFDRGFFTVNGYSTFITSGLGTSGPRARLFNPPEVVILEIKL